MFFGGLHIHKMTNEILQELDEKIIKMEGLIDKQIFTVGDAKKFLERYHNIRRKMEDLEISRDLWRGKCKEFKAQAKRQGLTVTIKELRELADELEKEEMQKGSSFQINIINKEGLSDTWKIESTDSGRKANE
jgi:glutamyl-tRNA reductase